MCDKNSQLSTLSHQYVLFTFRSFKGRDASTEFFTNDGMRQFANKS